MNNRHNLARIAPLAGATVLLFGCFGAHGPDGEEPARHDAGAMPDPDAGGGTAPIDAGTVVPPTPSCGSFADIEVRIETIGIRPCTPGRYDGVMVYGIDPLPGGAHLLLDMCPLADDDCRCGVTVTGIDGFVASELGPSGTDGVTVVLHERGVLVEANDPSCPMDDHSCVQYPIFAAASGTLESPPIDPDAIDLSWGEEACNAPAPELGRDCSTTSFDVVVTAWVSGFPGAIGTDLTFAPGESRPIEEHGTTFQLVRASISSCPDTRSVRTAAWATWRAR